jgi:hypothetical protein
MSRLKTPSESLRVKLGLAERLVVLRKELYGPRGGAQIARQLNLPPRTWYNYEKGITVPGEILLRVIDTFAVEPSWLIRGEGPRFRNSQSDRRGSESAANEGSFNERSLKEIALVLLRHALRMLENAEVGGQRDDGRGSGRTSMSVEPASNLPHDAGGTAKQSTIVESGHLKTFPPA